MKLLPFEYAIRNLGRSPKRLIMVVAGATLVSFIVTAAAGLVRGMSRSLGASANPRNVILLGSGSEESLERSEIGRQVASIVAASVPGLESAAGVALVSPEVNMALPIRIGKDPESESSERRTRDRSGMVRGITPAAFLVHPGARITEGRFPEAGEILVGPRAQEHLGLAPGTLTTGGMITIDQTPFRIVGRFEAPGTVMEPELWAPLSDVLLASKRNTVSCVIVTLGSGADAAELGDLQAFSQRRLDLEIAAISESSYFRGLSAFFAPIRWMVLLTAALVAFGAILGGLNTLYAAFSARIREIGALQAIGYSRAAILLSFAQESLLVSCVGALIAALSARLLLHGVGVSFSMGVFALEIDSGAVAIGLATGLVLGVVGALIPAHACLRTSIPQALKAA